MGTKILALVSEPVSGEALRSAIGGNADKAEVMVVAPALDSRTRFWASDNDEAKDALATFLADEIVIFTRPEGDRNWAEGDLVEQAQEQFSVPVRHMEVNAE